MLWHTTHLRRSVWILMGALLVTALFVSGCGDCIYSAQVNAWLDANENGLRDADEQPLEGILFHIDDVHNQFRKVGNAVSDSEGKAGISVWLPGCPKVKLQVYSEAPDEYRLTTAERFDASVSRTDEVFSFGYFYTPSSTPTPVPSPEPLACHRMPISYFSSYWLPIAFTDSGVAWTTAENHSRRLIEMIPTNHEVREYQRTDDFLGFADIYDMTLAPDGAVWFTTNSGVSRFDKGGWTSFIQDNGMHAGGAQDIAILPTKDVLVETEAGIEVLDPLTISWYILISPDALGNRDQNKFRTVGNEVWLIDRNQILRFWKDEPDSRVNWEVLWTPDTIPDMPLVAINDADLAPNGVLWVTGFDDQLRPAVVSTVLGSDSWTAYSYRTTGGAIGRSGIGGLEITSDGSVWLDESTAIVRGTATSDHATTYRWDRYDASAFVWGHDTRSISRIAASPDGAIWFATMNSWYRCALETPRG